MPPEQGDRTHVMRHWWVAKQGGHTLFIEGDSEADRYRRACWRVDGPFVRAEAAQGAVEVIERYARHDESCRSLRVLGQGPCSCGYEAARAAIFGGQSGSCPACSTVPGEARRPHTCSGERQ